MDAGSVAGVKADEQSECAPLPLRWLESEHSRLDFVSFGLAFEDAFF